MIDTEIDSEIHTASLEKQSYQWTLTTQFQTEEENHRWGRKEWNDIMKAKRGKCFKNDNGSRLRGKACVN